jgi:hypothetical protein
MMMPGLRPQGDMSLWQKREANLQIHIMHVLHVFKIWFKMCLFVQVGRWLIVSLPNLVQLMESPHTC